jgi:hypothetical protein
LTCSAMTARELDVLHDETVRTAMVLAGVGDASL